jgi:hypothetical protein
VTAYTFILRETATGAGDHGNYMKRRKAAEDYATGKGCTVLGKAKDMQINGSWYYWWFLDIPDMYSQRILADIETQFTVTKTTVEFAMRPVKI